MAGPASPPPPDGQPDREPPVSDARDADPNRETRGLQLRFGVRGLLILVTATAVVLGAGRLFGWWLPLSLAYLAFSVLPVCALATAAVFARGRVQAFCVGAAIGWVMLSEMMRVSVGLMARSWVIVLVLIYPMIGGLAGGYLALLTWREIRRRGLDRRER